MDLIRFKKVDEDNAFHDVLLLLLFFFQIRRDFFDEKTGIVIFEVDSV